MRHKDLLGIGSRLRAKAAPDILCDHAHVNFRNAEQRGQVLPHVIMRLRRNPYRELLPGAVEVGNNASRFKRYRGLANKCEAAANAMLRACHRTGGIPTRLLETCSDVADPLGMQRHRSGHDRGFDRRDRGQSPIFHLDELREIFGEITVRSDHQGDRLSDITHTVLGQEVDEAAANAAMPIAYYPSDVVKRQLARSEHRKRTSRARGPGVDRQDIGMRERATYESGMHHTVEMNIVDKAPTAAQQTRVFPAGRRSAGGASHGIMTLSMLSRSSMRARCRRNSPLAWMSELGSTSARSASIAASIMSGRVDPECKAVARVGHRCGVASMPPRTTPARSGSKTTAAATIAKSARRRANSRKLERWLGPALCTAISVMISSGLSSVTIACRKNDRTGISRTPRRLAIVNVASSAVSANGSSAEGSACATLPPTVPRLRVCRCPT